MDLLDKLNNHSDQFNIGSVGSPSNTTEIIIDINQKSEKKRNLGQLVCLVQPQDQENLVVIGQISEIETQNRWHEDLTFRGIIKRRGSLPHLSEKADVRTAKLNVQACFSIAPDGKITAGTLGTSPATGTPIISVRDEILDKLLEQYKNQIIYLGNAYATDVKMPLWLKHFDRGEGGAGEAYHIGVFGKSGSGKSGLAAYMLLGYAQHKNMGIIFIDPQNQFASETDLPFKLHDSLRKLGRKVEVYRLTNQIRLGTKNNAVNLFCSLLLKTEFYRNIGVRSKENQDYASDEVSRIIRDTLSNQEVELKKGGDDLLLNVLQSLRQDNNALQRVYASSQPRQRLQDTLQELIDNDREFKRVQQEIWQPVLDLFLENDSQGNRRSSFWHIVQKSASDEQKPIVFLDIKGEGTTFADNEEIKALILKEISTILKVAGENAFKEDKKLNCLICLDEAHRFVKSSFGNDDNSEMSNLTRTFVDGVRTTRKYGLGYMFITQTIASLHKEIVGQLRLYAFGYGLTSGSEYRQIEELVSDKQALSLYKSFVDPQSNKQYPFMFLGPVSPLSFTGSPLFVQMFTEFSQFQNANNLQSSDEFHF
ncbi:MAG: ATP-binding protein [Microcystis viridis Mv_BB_P_19951000_S69]|uniref:ATP-binding protein n=1 Tax=Microcystis viridis Mv_BB_P_19951000_S68D TaxID=2486270 RepID=A0A552I9C7_MICVR|nr:MAG: ATP-binding protein [Microcystis viridis Mv_BB_P_19951000_S68]TRU68771.1 MAG: ATP-binding protein [Microcystis viridis Mv_BB_P_19951000_S69]TRU80053.1 MAG: ATP-binding protein [Microcystis viridis Mv_BB_P_19951000_S68D]TRU83513.1 MAG: ATP-binding protein [Microcystis viridis Mv_BB_P_19951000_S69D]